MPKRLGSRAVDESKCVVFDVDDTLFLERDYVRSGFRRVGEWVGRNLGIPDFSDRAWRAFEEGARGSIFDRVLEGCEVDPTPQLVEELVGLYRSHEPDIEMCPDAKGCLEGLKGQVRLAAVTGGPVVSQRAKVHALGLTHWLDPIVFTAELGADLDKPSPRGFEVVEERTGCSGEDCVYVADNPATDFTGPKALGWRTIRVRRAGSLHFGQDSAPDVDVETSDLWGWTLLIDHPAAAERR